MLQTLDGVVVTAQILQSVPSEDDLPSFGALGQVLVSETGTIWAWDASTETWRNNGASGFGGLPA